MGRDANGFYAWGRDLKLAVIFFTRIPLPHREEITSADLGRALRAAPLAGLLIGFLVALAAGLANWLGLPPFAAGLAAVGFGVLLTGCLHEDGLTDVADGFGGAFQRERKLEIMKDSRTGSYGAAALILSIGLRAAALAALIPQGGAWTALPLAHALSRGLIPAMMATTPLARANGLASYHEPPGGETLWTALGLAALAALLLAGLAEGLLLLLLAAAAVAAMRLLTLRQIGGYTGDVLGATQQAGEIVLLLALAALIS